MTAEKEYLEIDGWIEGIEYLCILVKHGKTLIPVTNLVVRIRKLDHQGIVAFLNHADPVWGHLVEKYGLLCGYTLFFLFFLTGKDPFKLSLMKMFLKR